MLGNACIAQQVNPVSCRFQLPQQFLHPFDTGALFPPVAEQVTYGFPEPFRNPFHHKRLSCLFREYTQVHLGPFNIMEQFPVNKLPVLRITDAFNIHKILGIKDNEYISHVKYKIPDHKPCPSFLQGKHRFFRKPFG